MRYLVSLSGGVASAVAADRAIARYGRDVVDLWIADTSWEDDDLWRFVADCCKRWGILPYYYRDGRTPLQVAEDRTIIPNQKIAPCSFELKIEPFTRFLRTYPKPVTVMLGLDWKEIHRMEAPKKNYESIDGVVVDFPLMWEPIDARPYYEIVQSWGITPPRLYDLGFSHNNCGGRCVKQGIRQWKILQKHIYERFAEVRDWEQAQRAKGDARADYTIVRDQTNYGVQPMTLAQLEARTKQPYRKRQSKRGKIVDEGPSMDDTYGCMCSY